MMELTVRTLQGAVNLRAVPEDWTVADLKSSMHEGYPNLQVPEPHHQNLVHAGRVLGDGSLRSVGLKSGSTVVLLHTTPAPKPTPSPSIPAPTAADIRAAVIEEARRRGIEHKLRDEAPAQSHPSFNMPSELMDMDNQLMGLIEALEGRLGLLRQGGRQTGTGGADAGAELPLGINDMPGQQRSAAAPAQAPEPIPDIQPPEPEAEHVSQLCDMGFSEPVVRKALVLHRNRMPEAVEWLLVHSEDADAAAPVTQEQLRRIYGMPQARAPAAAPRAAATAGDSAAPAPAAAGAVASALRELHMSLLQAVGMDADSAQGLLDRAEGNAGPAAPHAASTAPMAGQQQPADPLETFRRLQQQLGEGRQGDLDAATSSLADLFPLALMRLGSGHEDDEEHDEDEDEDEGEEEEGEEEDDEDEEDEDGQGEAQGNAEVSQNFRF